MNQSHKPKTKTPSIMHFELEKHLLARNTALCCVYKVKNPSMTKTQHTEHRTENPITMRTVFFTRKGYPKIKVSRY